MKRKHLLTMLHCLLVLSLVLLPSLGAARPVFASASASKTTISSGVHKQDQTVASTVYGSEPKSSTNSVVTTVASTVYGSPSQSSTNSVVNSVHSAVYTTGQQFSVKSFGAVGNGSHDDTAAIQAAVNYVSTAPGAVAYFPQGTFLISSPVTIPSNTSLLGAGANSIIMGTAGSPYWLFFINTETSCQQHISISSLSFNCVSNPANNYLGLVAIEIGWGPNYPSHGFNNISITNNIFQNCNTAITVDDYLASGASQSNLTISNNNVTNTTRFGFGEIGNVNNLTISNNTLGNIGHDPDPNLTPWYPAECWDAIYVQNGSNITITNNNISNFGDNGIEVGYFPYASNVPVPSNINISSNTIEDALQTGNATTVNGDGILLTSVANCNIVKNTIQYMNKSGIFVRDNLYGTIIPTTNVTINNNTINNTIEYEAVAIDLANTINVPANNITITNNTFSSLKTNGVTYICKQISNGNAYTISNNNINNCGADFIYTASGGGTITNNTCNNTQNEGIVLDSGVEKMIMENNKLVNYGLSKSNAHTGIYAADGAGSVISSNTINSSNKGLYGIAVNNASNTSCTITNNSISNVEKAVYSTSPLNIVNNNGSTVKTTS